MWNFNKSEYIIYIILTFIIERLDANVITEFKSKIEVLQKQSKENDLLSTWIGFIKLGIVIFILFVIYRMITVDSTYGYYILIAILCYSVFAIWQSNIKRKIKVSEYAIMIYQRHIDRINGNWITFEDMGEEYKDENHLYANDLDVIGKKSLFQYLNITNTYYGRKQFVEDILSPTYTESQIHQRQQAISELSNNIEFVNEIEKKTIEIGSTDEILRVIEILTKKSNFILSQIIESIVYVIPVLATLLFISGLYFKILALVSIGLGLLIIQGLSWIVFLPKLQSVLQTVRKVPFRLSEYTNIFSYIDKQDFTSSKLKEIKAVIVNNQYSSSYAMKDLDKIINKISVESNFIIYAFLNIFLLWDFRSYIKFQKWQEKYSDSCEKWFIALGELESLMSFSILPMVSKHTCIPIIQEDKNKLEVIQLGHPLLHHTKRVNNDFSMNNDISIISGSNMSGKTTFMRTIGINLLLARTGSFVCAKSMHTSIFNLATSMRIADNLNEGVSTFYAELKNIKKILDIAKRDATTFFMIDEIFRGTNSVDRLEGAIMVVTKLQQLEISGMITTHDLDLCKLESKYPHIKNYHFIEDYKNNDIIFSYQIQNGVSTTTNAKQLMKMLGIM